MLLIKSSSRFVPVVILITVLGLSGCQTPGKKKAVQDKALLAQKQKDFDALLAALNTKAIPKGVSRQEIEERYGAPDDNFSAGGSSSGKLEVLTYGKLLAKDTPEQWRPIRLYFNDGKLIDWNY